MDYVFVGETFHRQEQALQSSSYYVRSSKKGAHHAGGVTLLARTSLKDRITAAEDGKDWVSFTFAGLRVGGIYLSPSLDPEEVRGRLEEMTGERKVDLVYGDFNVDLGKLVGRKGLPRPVERVEVVDEWSAEWELEVLLPIQGEAATWDQAFCRRSLFAHLWVISRAHLNFKTDHPLLRVSHWVENGHTDAQEEKGAERFRASLLRHEEVRKRYQREFRAYGEQLEDLSARLWQEAPTATHEERKTLVDTLDLGIVKAISEAAKNALGTYFASAVRNKRDLTAPHLSRSTHPSDALRLFKRSQRGRQPRIIPDSPDKLPMESAIDHYKEVFGADADVPELDEEEEQGASFEDRDRAFANLFKESNVIRVIRRYGQHKSPGQDSIHVSLLSALCPPEERGQKSTKERPRAGTPRAEFLIPTEPDPSRALNPLAPAFHPSGSSQEEAADYPLPRILSSLFRLSAACGSTPERWGETTVVLISKLKDAESSPTPADTRPIALLPMFRRLFEILLLPVFDPLGSDWAALDDRQAGFRSGWSCTGAILAVDSALASRYPCAAFFDFKSAHDSPPPRLILRSFKRLGMPLSVRQIVWSLLTDGANISLIVNGRRSPSFERRKGFPQGSPLSPLLFNLYLNSLLVRLNSLHLDVQAWAYADDLAAGARNKAGMRLLVGEAERWAREWGMRFNPKKCVLMARNGLYRSHVRGIILEGEELRVVTSTKYLGIERNGKGLQLKAYLDRKVNAMNRLLGGLQVAGGSWSPMTRLTIYRSFCRSLLEYGAPILYLYLKKRPQSVRRQYLVNLGIHHARAVTWIVGIANSAGKSQLASAMTGLVPPMVRFEHLALGLACFLEAAPPSNPTRILFLEEKRNIVARHSKYLHTLSNSLLPILFRRINEEQAARHQTPYTRSTFVRISSVVHFEKQSGKLASYIDSSNRPNGLVDGVLLAKSAPLRRLMIRWRANTFLYPLRCPVCGETFTRHCSSHALAYSPLVSASGPLEAEQLQKINQAFNKVVRRRREQGSDHVGSRFRLVDFLIGNKNEELREVGGCTLEKWAREMRAFSNEPLISASLLA